MNKFIVFSEEVQQAKQEGKPIVALESTIITHGMEYPQNVETALAVEQEIRAEGCVPATIAIMQGRCHVGLTQEQIQWLGENKHQVVKGSRRDISIILSQGKCASTTVALTMMICQAAGLKIFATGGIGGVHRGAETTFDISADLTELATTQVAVISAGCKSILDIPKTLEYLETQGVPVLGLDTQEFPAFFVSKSGYQCSASVSRQQCADAIAMQFDKLNLSQGIVVGNPVPSDQEADGLIIEQAIKDSLQEMNQQNISGARVTPFLLKRINELTGGASSASNVALIRHNARVAAQIAFLYQPTS